MDSNVPAVAAPLDPADAARQFAAALDAHRAGRLADAESRYRRLLAGDPDHADALHYCGVVRHQMGDHEAAAALIDRALRAAPLDAGCWSHRGLVALALGQRDTAIACLREALRIEPRFADASNNLGIVLQDAGALGQAIDQYRAALAANPAFVAARVNLGSALAKLGRHDEALAAYRDALALDPDDADTHFNAGNAHQARGELDEAIASFRRAIRLRPGFARALVNLGTALGRSGDYGAAEVCYREAVRHDPGAANLVCVGAALGAQGRNDEEEHWYRRALELDPQHADARQNLVWLQLKRGEYRAGWAGYVQRWRAADYDTPSVEGIAPWRGEALDNRTLLLVHEQGFGDQLQFIRYASVLHACGASVDVCVPPQLLRLAQSVPGVRRAWSGVPAGSYDFWLSMMDAPAWVGTELATIPAEVPYLQPARADVELWHARVQTAAGEPVRTKRRATNPDAQASAMKTQRRKTARVARKIGLVWAGNPGFYNDRNRSLALASLWLPLADTPNVSWFALQKGVARDQIAALPDTRNAPCLHDFTVDLHDFADTAALIMNLDLVITVDTAVAHLAGALGQPVWILVPANAEWRWLEHRSDSPWYPSARLFRQRKLGAWASVIDEVRRALSET